MRKAIICMLIFFGCAQKSSGTITGTVYVCPSSTYTYVASAVQGATNYGWSSSLPGSTFSSNGNTLILNTGSGSGIINVLAYDSNNNLVSQSLTLYMIQPPTVNCPITGTLLVCPGTWNVYYGWCNIYTQSHISPANSTWTFPPGWTYYSLGPPQQSNGNSFVGPNAQSGIITTYRTYECGYTQTQTVSVTAVNTNIQGNAFICPNTTNTYTAAPVLGALSYTWTLPSGWSGSSNTNTLTATANASSGTITVSATSSLCNSIITQTFAVYTTPQSNLTISGNTITCQGVINTYTAGIVNGASNYTWTLPPNWTGSSNTYTIDVTSGPSPGTLTVSALDGCGMLVTQTLAVTITPAATISIVGNPIICPGPNQLYKVISNPALTGVNWTLPQGWTSIPSGNNIYATTNNVSGLVTVSGVDACGNSVSQSMSVTVLSPQPMQTVSGPTVVCPNTTYTYTALPVPGATGYSWNLPPNWINNSSVNSNTISVTTGNNPGMISVSAISSCGFPATQTLLINIFSPQNNLNISGNILICPNSTNTYTAGAVTGATSYNWNIPGGWTGSSTTNIIAVTSNSSPGSINVLAIDMCGNSISQNLFVNIITPQTGLTISGNATVCPGSAQVYAATPVTGAGSYTWTLPGTGWTGISNTANINVIAGTSSGVLSVSAIDICGVVITQTLNITLPPTNLSIAGSTFICAGSINIYTATPVAGASSYNWTLPPTWTGVPNTTLMTATAGANSGIISVSATDLCGTLVTQTLAVTAAPMQTGLAITGPTLVCLSLNLNSPLTTYTAGAVTGATSYTVTWPGIGPSPYPTNVVYGYFFSAGTLSISALNNCGSIVTQTLAVTAYTGVTNPIIAGNTLICPSSTNTYTATLIPGASVYNWSKPGGWTGTSTTNTISITAGSNSGAISVSAIDLCGNPVTQSLPINLIVSQTGLTITGSSSVCPVAPFTYVAGSVNGATAYNWTLPAGWIINSTSSNTINITTGTTGGIISVSAIDVCGNTITQSFTTTMTPLQTNLSIAGSTLACFGGLNGYTATPVNGAQSYTWTLPPGWPTPPSTNIMTTYLPGAAGIISVSAINNCGVTVTQTLAVSGYTPVYTSSISGPTLVCPGSVNNYTAGVVYGATSYTWGDFNGPLGGSSTTTLITITAPLTNSLEILNVFATDICGFQQNKVVLVYVMVPQTTLTIAGNTLICPNSTNSYTAGIVTGATSYTWSLPPGWNPAPVSTTTLITITAGLSPGTLTVSALNGCGVVITQTIAINFIPTQTNLSISGYSLICPGNVYNYTATPVTGASVNGYTWSFPLSWSGISTGTVINLTTGTVPATISVSALNGCGILVTQTLAINAVPSLGLSVVNPNVTFCSNQTTTVSMGASTTFTALPTLIYWAAPPPAPLTIFSLAPTVTVAPLVNTTYTVYAAITLPGFGCALQSSLVNVNITTNCCSQPTLGLPTVPPFANGNFTGGTYLIDQNVTLTGNTLFDGEFLIMPNVQITVPPGFQLYMRSAHLYACGLNMWQGIDVQNGGSVIMSPSVPPNFIEDAIVAVNIDNYPSPPSTMPLVAQGTIFNKNYTSINISNCPSCPNFDIRLRACVFTSRDIYFNSNNWVNTGTNFGDLRYAAPGATLGLSPPYQLQNYPSINLKSPYNSQPANVGINLSNVGNGLGPNITQGLDIGFIDLAKEDQFNLFDNLGTGIEITDASIVLMNAVFQNMQRFNTTFGVTGGTGIKHTVTGMMNAQLNLDPAFNANQSTSSGLRFWNCYKGIEGSNILNFKISYGVFRSNQSNGATPPPFPFMAGNSGIDLTTNRFDYRAGLCEFNNVKNGITITTLAGPYNINGSPGYGIYTSNLLIEQNFFGAHINSTITTVNGEYLSDAIRLVGNGSSGWQYLTSGVIQSNKINRAYRGISVNNMNVYGVNVQGNLISLVDEVNALTPVPRQFGIQGIASLNGLYILSNTLSAINVSNTNLTLVHCRSNSANCIVQCNDLNTSYQAFEFEGTNAVGWKGNSMQNHVRGLVLNGNGIIGQQGSYSMGYDNRWLGFWPSNTYHTFIINSNASSSPLFVRNNNSMFIPTNNGLSSGTAYVINQNIIPTSNAAPYNCPPMGLPAPPSQRNSSVEMDLSIEQIDTESGLNIYIYPNPSEGKITISTEEEKENLRIRILDISGKQLYAENIISKGLNTLDLSSFVNGIYLIEVQNSASEKFYKKLILAK